MGNIQIAITILCLIAVVLLVFFAFCHTLDIVTWVTAWIWSNREEKAGLTRTKGHYNANGYLVHSDSDIHLDSTGSFKRFESVDTDFRITLATTSLMGGEWNNCDQDFIPPQPLRPAPVPKSTLFSPTKESPPLKPPSTNDESTFIEKTSISPIPRPVSSVNVATLASQSSFPVCLSPPPTPSTPSMLCPSLSSSQLPPPPPSTPMDTAASAVVTPMKFNINATATFMQQVPPVAMWSTSPRMAPPEGEAGGGDPPRAHSQCDDVEVISAVLKRAISCDSICSDTSVALGDLEEFNITGYLCIGLEYDSECCDLVVNVLEAKELVGTLRGDDFLDTYVRVFLLPDKDATIQTRIYKSSSTPSYKERFLFSLNPREQSQRSLCFHVYATDLLSHTLIGEGDIRLSDISLRQPVTTWVTLTDTGQQKGTEFGEIMFSLSYLPTAERLTVVVVKARNLKFPNDGVGDAFVKVYLMQQNKKINKKKTSTKKAERCPIYNEAMMFSVPAHTLPTIQLRLTIAEPSTSSECPKAYSIGHVIVGSQASGRCLSHWNQMLIALRKPVAMWHSLRK